MEILLGGKEKQKVVAGNSTRDHLFFDFDNDPQRECLYFKNVQWKPSENQTISGEASISNKNVKNYKGKWNSDQSKSV